MSDISDDIKAAERRGYSRGYAAGRSKGRADRSAEDIRKQRQAMLDRIYITLLPVYLSVDYLVGDQKERGHVDRIKRASEMATVALKHRPIF